MISLPRLSQLCLDNAVIWFCKDSRGGWSELQLKLENNGLEMRVCKIPADRSVLLETVVDLVQSCTAQGARDIGPITQALTFTEQVAVLTEKGLIGKASGSSTPPPPTQTRTPEEDAMLLAHKTEVLSLEIGHKMTKCLQVRNYLQQELYENVSDTEPPREDVGPPVLDGDGAELEQLELGQQPVTATIEALAAELNVARDSNKKLQQKVVTYNHKILQLENENATGNYGLNHL